MKTDIKTDIFKNKTIKLREYQEYFVNRGLEALGRGEKVLLLRSHTGTGKTMVIHAINHNLDNKKIFFCTPRINLTHQTVDKDLKRTQGLIQGNIKRGANSDVICWNIQTLYNYIRRNRLIPTPDIIEFDECHVEIKKQKEIIDYFKERNPNLQVIGLSATPYTPNKAPLEVWESAYELNNKYRDMWHFVDKGFIAPIKYLKVGEIDRSLLKENSSGDYTEKSQEEALENSSVDIVGQSLPYLQEYSDYFAIVFTPSISKSEEIARQFRERGVSAEAYHSNKKLNMDTEKALDKFKRKEIRVLVTVDKVKFGTDVPLAKINIMATAMKTPAYIQSVGRTARPYKNQHNIVLDFVGNIENGHPYDEVVALEKEEWKKRKKKKFVCVKCESEDLTKIDGFYDEEIQAWVNRYKCNDCNEINLKIKPIPTFECEKCNTYNSYTKAKIFIKSFKKFGVCENCKHENFLEQVLPYQLVEVVHDRQKAIGSIETTSFLAKQVKNLLEQIKDIATDTLIASSLELIGKGSEKSLKSLLSVLGKFAIFTHSFKGNNKDRQKIIAYIIKRFKDASVLKPLSKLEGDSKQGLSLIKLLTKIEQGSKDEKLFISLIYIATSTKELASLYRWSKKNNINSNGVDIFSRGIASADVNWRDTLAHIFKNAMQLDSELLPHFTQRLGRRAKALKNREHFIREIKSYSTWLKKQLLEK